MNLSLKIAQHLKRQTDLYGSTLFALTWKEQVTPAGRSLFRLVASEPLTEGSVFIGWPTPTASERSGQGPANKSLFQDARLASWPTPTDIGKHRDGTKAQISSESEARLTAFGETPIGYLLGPNGWEIVPASGQLNAAHSRWLMGLPPIWDKAGIAAFRSLKGRKRGSRVSVDTGTE